MVVVPQHWNADEPVVLGGIGTKGKLTKRIYHSSGSFRELSLLSSQQLSRVLFSANSPANFSLELSLSSGLGG